MKVTRKDFTVLQWEWAINLRDDGYEAGYHDGNKDGFAEGVASYKHKGIKTEYCRGLDQGHQEGWDQLLKDFLRQGIDLEPILEISRKKNEVKKALYMKKKAAIEKSLEE